MPVESSTSPQQIPAQPILAQQILAFDLGGSHIAAGLFKFEGLQPLQVASVPLPGEFTLPQFLGLLASLADQVAASPQNVAGASFAVPGPFDYAAGVSRIQHKLHALYGIDLRQVLSQRFAWTPECISFLNDAQAFLLGEVSAGAAHGAHRAAGITLGTGIGSAFAVGGRIVTSGPSVPPGGEIWNMPHTSGSLARTVEDSLSTRALQADYQARTGRYQEVAAIAAAAPADADARAVFAAFGAQLGDVFRDIFVPFAPEVIVLGGGISRSSQLFLPFAVNSSNPLPFRVATSTLLERAQVIGAAAFWRDSHGQPPA